MLEEVTIDILTEVGGADGAGKKSEFHLLFLILHHLVSVLVPHLVKITFHNRDNFKSMPVAKLFTFAP